MKNKDKELSVEIRIPEKISFQSGENMVIVKGPKGEIKKDFSFKKIKIINKDGVIKLVASKSNKVNKKLVKSYSSHIKNMIKGSLEGFKYTLKICSGHFPMNVSVNNNQLIVKNFFGEKVPRTLMLKPGASVKIEGDTIIVESPNKEIAGQVSADIEILTRRTGYDSRIFQDGIHITSKDGKEIQ